VETRDLPEIHAIYRHYVLNSLASFELEPPSLETLRQRQEAIAAAGLPYLVCAQGDAIAGYAYASAFRPRPAYRFTVENSVYVAPGLQGRGVGRSLLEALIEACSALGLRRMIAVISDKDSVGFHARLGFRHAGTLPAAGFKFDRWVDVILMERPLGEGEHSPPQA
jgi:L-amino acid N-acyltransferase YncA